MSKQKLNNDDNPEWRAEDFKRAKPFSALPESLRNTLIRRGRPKKEAPKVAVSIRLSPDVLERFKSTGPGWQARLDAALRDWLQTHHAA
jgi:uncharacterized protein (DUF4415 family)